MASIPLTLGQVTEITVTAGTDYALFLACTQQLDNFTVATDVALTQILAQGNLQGTAFKVNSGTSTKLYVVATGVMAQFDPITLNYDVAPAVDTAFRMNTTIGMAYVITAPTAFTVKDKATNLTLVEYDPTNFQQGFYAIGEEIYTTPTQFTGVIASLGFKNASSLVSSGGGNMNLVTTKELKILNPYTPDDNVHLRITTDASNLEYVTLYQEGTKGISAVDFTDFPEVKVEGLDVGTGGAYFGGHVVFNNGCTVNTAPVHPNDPMRKGDVDALIWTGTAEQWNALTSEQQASYKVEMITA